MSHAVRRFHLARGRQEGKNIADTATEASRVFRRLLFVRRSHDERYKEQVFT